LTTPTFSTRSAISLGEYASNPYMSAMSHPDELRG
jgi:hypothetical protein